MKKISLPALAALILAVVIAAGSVSFLGPCVHQDGSFGTCHWAGQAVFGIGLLLCAQSLLALLLRDGCARMGVFLSMLATALLGFLTPGMLIPLCGMATMRCRALMQPAMRILFGIVMLAALLGTVAECRKSGRKP